MVKRQNLTEGLIDVATDWVCQIDLRQQQTHYPPHIITTSDRPDIAVYYNSAKVVVIVELTSPAEESIEKWREIKTTKYESLAENIREGGIWKVFVFTVEVGARGFVAKRTAGLWRRLDLIEKDVKRLKAAISHTTIS